MGLPDNMCVVFGVKSGWEDGEKWKMKTNADVFILSDNTADNSCSALHTGDVDDDVVSEGNVFNYSSRCHLSLVYPKNAKTLIHKHIHNIRTSFFKYNIFCEFLTIFSKFSQYSLSLSSNIFNFFTSFSFKNVKFHRVITSFGEQTDSLSKPYWTLQFFPQLPACRQTKEKQTTTSTTSQLKRIVKWKKNERTTNNNHPPTNTGTRIRLNVCKLGMCWL